MDENNQGSHSLLAKTDRFIRSGIGFGPRTTVASQRLVKMSAMEEQWEFFVASAKDKAESHTKASRFWGNVDTFFGLALIFLSASITATALLDGVPKEVVAGIGAVSTMIAATASFLKSSDRRQIHEKTAKAFRSLMVKMISCECEKDYEKLWADFNREITEEPIMPSKFVTSLRMKFTMTPELREVIEEKELASLALEKQRNQEREAAEKAAEELKKDSDESTGGTEERKEKWKSVIEIPDVSFYGNDSMSERLIKKTRYESEEPPA